MDRCRWIGSLNVPLSAESSANCRVAASLCISPSEKLLVSHVVRNLATCSHTLDLIKHSFQLRRVYFGRCDANPKMEPLNIPSHPVFWLLSLYYGIQVPTANAIFFNGDRVEGTGNPVIERLSDIQNIAEILGSKLGPSINTWVIDASTFNGPFAVYKEFIPSLNRWGEPQSYTHDGYPASTSVTTLLSNFLSEVDFVWFIM